MHLLAFARGGPDRAGTRLGVQTTDGGIHDLTDALGARDVGEMLALGRGVADIEDLRTASDPIDPSTVVIRAPIARPGVVDAVPRIDEHERAAGIDAIDGAR